MAGGDQGWAKWGARLGKGGQAGRHEVRKANHGTSIRMGPCYAEMVLEEDKKLSEDLCFGREDDRDEAKRTRRVERVNPS